MFAFRNRSSPTTSQLLRLSRSPVHLTIHYHAGDGAPALPMPDPARRAAAEIVIALLQDMLDQPPDGRQARLPDARPFEAIGDSPPLPADWPRHASAQPSRPHAAALVLGAASVVLAATALAARNAGARRLPVPAPPAALPAPAPASVQDRNQDQDQD